MPVLDQVYQKDPNIIFREIGGEVILVPIKQNVRDLENTFALNETAAFAWEKLDGVRTLGEILTLIIAEYEVGQEEAQDDLLELVAQLIEAGALVEANR